MDEAAYLPVPVAPRWDLGYLGTYSDDRQPALERLLLDVARRLPGRRFAVAGPQYPPTIAWPANVERLEHVAPEAHPAFYAACRFTLNVTPTGTVSPSGWKITGPAGSAALPVTGAYSTDVAVNNIPIVEFASGSLTLNIEDADTPPCSELRIDLGHPRVDAIHQHMLLA